MLFQKPAWNIAGIILPVVLWFSPSAASAQSGDTEAGEVAVLTGGTLSGIGAQPLVTGSAAITFSRYGMALLEMSFMPMGQHTIQSWPARSAVDRSYTYDFGFNFHIRIPVKEHWAPYALIGPGLLWNLFRQETVDSRGVVVVRDLEQVNGALHAGAGLRYYIGKNWGLRPELKFTVSKQTYTQLTLGVFYVTGPNWP